MLNSHSDLKILSHLEDEEGRFLAINIKVNDQTLTIASIYSPTQERPKEQAEVLEKIEELLSQIQGENIIVGGDFNCIRDTDLDKNKPGPGHPRESKGE